MGWLDQCFFYHLFQKELEFIKPKDDGSLVLAAAAVKAIVLSPVVSMTMQAAGIELLVRTMSSSGEINEVDNSGLEHGHGHGHEHRHG